MKQIFMTLALLLMAATEAWADETNIGSIAYNTTLGAYEIRNADHLNDLAVYVNGTGSYSTGGSETTAHDCTGLTFRLTDDITYSSKGLASGITAYEGGLLYEGKYYTGILLSDDGDNSAAITEGEENATVTIDGRTFFKDYSWNTLCLPFNMTADQVYYQLNKKKANYGLAGFTTLQAHIIGGIAAVTAPTD